MSDKEKRVIEKLENMLLWLEDEEFVHASFVINRVKSVLNELSPCGTYHPNRPCPNDAH